MLYVTAIVGRGGDIIPAFATADTMDGRRSPAGNGGNR
jgi:hypothetical protein